jgi:hypothetical protein
MTEKMTLEQKIVKHLADKGYITNVGDVTRALKEILYAELMITGNPIPGLKDEIEEGINSGDIDIDIEDICDHEPLSNNEIQEVFDNDYYEKEEQNSSK